MNNAYWIPIRIPLGVTVDAIVKVGEALDDIARFDYNSIEIGEDGITIALYSDAYVTVRRILKEIGEGIKIDLDRINEAVWDGCDLRWHTHSA